MKPDISHGKRYSPVKSPDFIFSMFIMVALLFFGMACGGSSQDGTSSEPPSSEPPSLEPPSSEPPPSNQDGALRINAIQKNNPNRGFL